MFGMKRKNGPPRAGEMRGALARKANMFKSKATGLEHPAGVPDLKNKPGPLRGFMKKGYPTKGNDDAQYTR